ncbi:MAG: hypothetical protein QXP66_01025 [Candidatus Aenigmatarchaeota archaeon]
MVRRPKGNPSLIAKYLSQFINEPISILCARYWYRGIVKEVGKDAVILAQPYVIEETGPVTDEKPKYESEIPSDILVSFEAIELICRPTWTFHNYEKSEKSG